MILQLADVHIGRGHARLKREVRRAARGLPHHEARTRDARRRLAAVRHRSAAAGDEQVVDPERHQHAVGELVVAARRALETELDVARLVLLHRPAVHANGVRKIGAVEHIVLGELMHAADAPRLANADLWGDVREVRALEARRRFADELERLPDLPASFDFPPGELLGIDAADRGAIRVTQLCEVGAPFDRIRLRAHDRLLARKAPPRALRFLPALGARLPGLAPPRRINAADAVHGRGIENVALAVAHFVRRPGPAGEIAVARAVDEDPAAYRASTGLRLYQQMAVAITRAQRMEERLHFGGHQHLVGDQFVSRDVVCLGLDAPTEKEMWRAERAHAFQSLEHLVGDAVHHLAVFAIHPGVQPAEIRQARRRASAAEKAVAL